MGNLIKPDIKESQALHLTSFMIQGLGFGGLPSSSAVLLIELIGVFRMGLRREMWRERDGGGRERERDR